MGAEVKYIPKTKPFSHQAKEFDEHRNDAARAIFWEQGTGKTKCTLDNVCYQYVNGNIDGLLVVAPNGVHLNWVTDEIPAHVPENIALQIRSFVFQSAKAGTKAFKSGMERLMNHRGLAVLCISFDGFMTKAGKDAVADFLWKRKVFYVIDESGRIKNPKALRTKSIVKSGAYAPFRRILNGTPIVQGPFDAYSQIGFLDPTFWKRHELGSFTVFKNHFGLFHRVTTSSGQAFDKLVSYRRLDQLSDILSSISTRVTKEEVLDLPPKIYSKRYYEMTKAQREIYDKLKNEYMAMVHEETACEFCEGVGRVVYEGVECPCVACEGEGVAAHGMVTAELAIVRMLRLQQVLCGYVPIEKFDGNEDPELVELPGGNPRLELFSEIVEDLPHSFIVFARFTTDIDLIMKRLADLGISAVRYDGRVSDDERAAAKQAFQKDGTATAFVANTSAAAEGLTLTRAKTVIYYSNYFSLHYRLQSEDRAHRIGQDQHVNYIDLECPHTIDTHVIKTLRKKFDVAKTVNRDHLKEWLSE